MRLKDKVALVTGAASGFGLGIAEAYAREGARVGLVDIDEAGAKRAAEVINGDTLAIGCDVTDGDQVAAAVKAIETKWNALDIVVNNAGWSHHNKPVLDVTEEDYDRVFAINVKSIFHMVRSVVPVMRARGGGGVMLNIGSTAGIRPRPGLSWYNATKGAVNLVSKSLAVELAPDKIRVNAIAPVMGVTGLLENFMGVPDTPEARAKFVATIPLGRMSTPEDIANTSVFLASDEAEFLTGVVMEVDGGRCV
ncbi:MAG: SDR family oxidoreductase [Pseudomonadota bacterium]